MPYAFVRRPRARPTWRTLRRSRRPSAVPSARMRQSKVRQRPAGDNRSNHFWSLAGEGLDGGGADYAAAFKAHKAAHGIKSERKGAAVGLRLLVGVSPEWLSETPSWKSISASQSTAETPRTRTRPLGPQGTSRPTAFKNYTVARSRLGRPVPGTSGPTALRQI